MTNESKKYSIEEVFAMIGEDNLSTELYNKSDKSAENQIEVDGYSVYTRSLRYMTFYQKGTKCVCCGKEGTHFRLDGDSTTDRRHFNLYADDGTLITKDHIIPKSKGGRDAVSNMQTMCYPCNKAKGATCEGHEKEYIVGTNSNGKEICFSTIEKAAYYIAINECKLNAKKIPKEEALKGAIGCVLKLQSAIENHTQYARHTWKKEMR